MGPKCPDISDLRSDTSILGQICRVIFFAASEVSWDLGPMSPSPKCPVSHLTGASFRLTTVASFRRQHMDYGTTCHFTFHMSEQSLSVFTQQLQPLLAHLTH